MDAVSTQKKNDDEDTGATAATIKDDWLQQPEGIGRDEPSVPKVTTRTNLKIMYTNADTVTNKLNELFLLAESHQLDIIMITEIKPKYSNETTDSARYKLEGYQMYTNLDNLNSTCIRTYKIQARATAECTRLNTNQRRGYDT